MCRMFVSLLNAAKKSFGITIKRHAHLVVISGGLLKYQPSLDLLRSQPCSPPAGEMAFKMCKLS